jgi:hypothetical protein
MKKILITSLLAMMTTPLIAQNDSVSQGHQPNQYTLVCLESPTRDCAFSAAIQTVIAEKFGVERAKVLAAVAKSMIATGQRDNAIETLNLALEEARSVNLSLVTQEKITEIAPLFARADDTATALTLVEEIVIESVHERTLINIARENMVAGRIADANVALGQMKSEARAFWQRLSLLTIAPNDALAAINLPELEAKLREYSMPSQLYRGLVLLSVIADKIGQPDSRQVYLVEADEYFQSILAMSERAIASAQRLRIMYDGGATRTLLEQSYTLANIHANRARGLDTLQTVALIMGPAEVGMGYLDPALRRLDVFTELSDKARYLSELKLIKEAPSLAVETRALLLEVNELEGAYERDLVRLKLLDGALENEDITLALNIIKAIEDDDNQARGLALLAPLLD